MRTTILACAAALALVPAFFNPRLRAGWNMTDDEHGCARLTVTLPTDLLTSLIQMAGRLRLTPSQIVECACRDLLTREPRSPNHPSPPDDGRPSSYVEMTAREEAHDIPAPPPPRSSAIDFRPVRRDPAERASEPRPVPGHGAAARATSASSEPYFSRSARAAEAFAQEQASRGSWLCDHVCDEDEPKPAAD
jgi:hypothetical protein